MDRPLSPWLLGCSAWGLWAGEAGCSCPSQPQFPHLSYGGEDGGAEAPAPPHSRCSGRELAGGASPSCPLPCPPWWDSPVAPQATLCARRGCMEAIVAQLASESEELHQVQGEGR